MDCTASEHLIYDALTVHRVYTQMCAHRRVHTDVCTLEQRILKKIEEHIHIIIVRKLHILVVSLSGDTKGGLHQR